MFEVFFECRDSSLISNSMLYNSIYIGNGESHEFKYPETDSEFHFDFYFRFRVGLRFRAELPDE